MEKIILVFAFGGLGSLMRFGVSSYTKTIVGTTFPLGTLIVNCLGSFLFGDRPETQLRRDINKSN